MPLKFQLWNLRRFLRGAFSLGNINDIRQGLAASHVNSHWLVNPRRIVPKKTQWKWTRGMWQDSCDARFLWKNTYVGAVGCESYKFTVTLNARRVLLQKTHGIWKGSRDARFSWKRNWIRERLVACHMNLQSRWTQDAFYMRNTRNLGGQYSAPFTWENIARGARGSSVACKFTVKMKARRILHKKTQRFLWGRREYIYINKEQR